MKEEDDGLPKACRIIKFAIKWYIIFVGSMFLIGCLGVVLIAGLMKLGII